jgi:hypothetical protein
VAPVISHYDHQRRRVRDKLYNYITVFSMFGSQIRSNHTHLVMSRLHSVILVNSVCVLDDISFVYYATLTRRRELTTHPLTLHVRSECATVAHKL